MNERLTLQDLVDLLAKQQNITKKDAEAFLRELFALISENIEKNESVKIKDFGTFKLVKVNSRKSVDVNTGEAIEIAAHYKLSFVPEKALRDIINRPFSHFESVLIEDGVDLDKEWDEKMAVSPILESKSTKASQELLLENEIGAENTTSQEEESIEISEPEIIVPIKGEEERNVSVKEDVLLEEDFIDAKIEVVDTLSDNKDESHKEENIKESVEEPDEFELELERSRKKKIWATIITIVVVILAVILYLNKDRLFSLDSTVDNQVSAPTEVETPMLEDSTLMNDGVVKDSLNLFVEQKEVEEPDQFITFQTGHTLRSLGFQFYGNKAFWVYIYEANKDKIANPNNVPTGTSLRIPPAKKYNIDPKNPESIRAARVIEAELFAKFQ